MTRGVRSPFGVSTYCLVLLIGACLFQVARSECQDKLFVELNQDLTLHEIETILKQAVSESIGEARVSQLLNLLDSSCESEEIASRDILFDKSALYCDREPNRGALKFFEAYWPKLQESCRAEVKRLLASAMESFFGHPVIVKLFRRGRGKSSDPAGRAHALVKTQLDYMDAFNINFDCANLTKALPRFSLLIRIVGSSDGYIEQWHYYWSTCRLYLLEKCFTQTYEDSKLVLKLRPDLDKEDSSRCEDADRRIGNRSYLID